MTLKICRVRALGNIYFGKPCLVLVVRPGSMSRIDVQFLEDGVIFKNVLRTYFRDLNREEKEKVLAKYPHCGG